MSEKTYLLNCKGNKLRRVSVPDNWRLTFGPTVPGMSSKYAGGNTWSLRFYQGNKENLRAVFSDVESFREEGIKIQERITKVRRQRAQKEGKAGAKDVMVEARVTEWVDPDADVDGEEDEFLGITFEPEAE